MKEQVYRNKRGQFHREDGPAVIYPDGEQHWYIHGQLHREDGPAIIFADGSRFWYINGKCHREDGPAVIYTSGQQYWCLNDVIYTELEYYKKLYKMGKITEEELFIHML